MTEAMRIRLATVEAKRQRILLLRHQVTAVIYQIGLCEDLDSLIADPDFPFDSIPWTTTLRLSPSQIGRAVPLLLELQQVLKE